MSDIDTVIERTKKVLCNKYESEVLDKNVAYELGLSATNLSSMKARRFIPYHELTTFCITKKVNMNWLFFGLGSMKMDLKA